MINFHHHGENSRGNPEKDKGDIVQHRLAFIGVTGFTSRLLKQLVPIQQVTLFIHHIRNLNYRVLDITVYLS